jgi:hypothetical protein
MTFTPARCKTSLITLRRRGRHQRSPPAVARLSPSQPTAIACPPLAPPRQNGLLARNLPEAARPKAPRANSAQYALGSCRVAGATGRGASHTLRNARTRRRLVALLKGVHSRHQISVPRPEDRAGCFERCGARGSNPPAHRCFRCSYVNKRPRTSCRRARRWRQPDEVSRSEPLRTTSGWRIAGDLGSRALASACRSSGGA